MQDFQPDSSIDNHIGSAPKTHTIASPESNLSPGFPKEEQGSVNEEGCEKESSVAHRRFNLHDSQDPSSSRVENSKHRIITKKEKRQIIRTTNLIEMRMNDESLLTNAWVRVNDEFPACWLFAFLSPCYAFHILDKTIANTVFADRHLLRDLDTDRSH